MKYFLFILLYLGMGFHSIFSEENKTTRIKLQLKWKHQFQFAGYYIAKEKGYFREAGLDVEILEAEPGVDPVSQVIDGKAEFGVGTSELILNRYKGDPIVVLGVVFQHSPLSIITLEKSGIDNVHKLSGRKLMIEHNSSELFAYLRREGLTHKAFTIQNHSFDIDDLINSKTDAMSVYITDELFHFEKLKMNHNLFHPRMGGIDFYGDNLFTMEGLIEEKPKLVNAFREASFRGWKYAMSHQEETIQLIYNSYSKRHSLDHLRFEAKAMYDLMQPDSVEPGFMSPGRWQHMSFTYHELGLLPEYFSVEEMLYFTSSAIALKKLKIKIYILIGGFSFLVILIFILFRFYRKARISEDRLKIMLDNAPVSMIVLNDKNEVESWNTEAEKMFLWNQKEIIGEKVLKIVPNNLHTDIEGILREVHSNFTIYHHQNSNIRKDGKEIICEWMNAPFRGKKDTSNFVICMARDITEKKRLEEQLERAAHYDYLTSLPNRAFILEKLKNELISATAENYKLAILFIDLDKFKEVNDTLGHEAGDILLQIVSEKLKEGIRKEDSVGRLGGDEFLIILPNVDDSLHAKNKADTILQILSLPCKVKGNKINISASIGIGIFPDDAMDINSLIHIADQNMYNIKKGN